MISMEIVITNFREKLYEKCHLCSSIKFKWFKLSIKSLESSQLIKISDPNSVGRTMMCITFENRITANPDFWMRTSVTLPASWKTSRNFDSVISNKRLLRRKIKYLFYINSGEIMITYWTKTASPIGPEPSISSVISSTSKPGILITGIPLRVAGSPRGGGLRSSRLI